MSTPTPPAPQEQISFEDILAAYREQVSGLTHELVMMSVRLKNRDETIESLLRQRDMPDPHK